MNRAAPFSVVVAPDGASRPQSPYFYRFRFGDALMSVVSDGSLDLGDPSASFLGLTQQEVRDTLGANFLPTDSVVLEQNVMVIEADGRTMLFETGMGDIAIFGPRTGRLQISLREAGIDPVSIDAVICSHAHIDHIGGICAADGTPRFPNAKIYISQRDFDDWTDEGRLSDPAYGIQIAAARQNLLPVRERIVFYADGEEFLPGLTALASPGHTLGHHCFMFDSGGRTVCLMGDLTHHQILLCELPKTQFRDDANPQEASQSRIRILGMLADRCLPVFCYHYPWPGYGHIVRNGEGFRYLPTPMSLDPLPPIS